MNQIAIRAEHLSKRYAIGGPRAPYGSLRDSLMNALKAPTYWSRFTHRQRNREFIWALQDATFEIQKGEVLGFIGPNGAGKSTLLKILSRITAPTAGHAELHGRVGSLLEVGTGFHPELTGRDNVFLNGAILNMHRAEIQRKFDDIVQFAGVEQFLDTPVNHYSSGMRMRLAFAVAAHLEAEILLIDEVLAVGDAEFQKKCLAKIGDLAGEHRTVVFVSHNMTAVQGLCTKVIWLEKGRVVRAGHPRGVIAEYLRTGSRATMERRWDDIAAAPGNDRVRLRQARVIPRYQPDADIISVDTPLLLEFQFWNLIEGPILKPSVALYNDQGILVFNTAPVTHAAWRDECFPRGLIRSACLIPGNLLNDGQYTVQLYIVEEGRGVLLTID